MIFSDVITHKLLGDIYLYRAGGKVLEVSLNEPGRYEFESSPGELAQDFPELYHYLENYGNVEIPPFTHDILDLSTLTPFYKKVYETLFYVPYGTLITYRGLSLKAGYGNAYRAVGSAMRKNRLLLLLPCHRVVASDSLGGFVSGMDTKLTLLDMEGIDYSHLL